MLTNKFKAPQINKNIYIKLHQINAGALKRTI